MKKLITTSDVSRDILMFTSFRYCLGRHTYVVSCCAEILIANASHISPEKRTQYIREINEHFFDYPVKDNLMHKCDYEQWQSVKNVFQQLNDMLPRREVAE